MGENIVENFVQFLANNFFYYSFDVCVKRNKDLTEQNHIEISTKFYSMHIIFSPSPIRSLSYRKWGKLETKC